MSAPSDPNTMLTTDTAAHGWYRAAESEWTQRHQIYWHDWWSEPWNARYAGVLFAVFHFSSAIGGRDSPFDGPDRSAGRLG